MIFTTDDDSSVTTSVYEESAGRNETRRKFSSDIANLSPLSKMMTKMISIGFVCLGETVSLQASDREDDISRIGTDLHSLTQVYSFIHRNGSGWRKIRFESCIDVIE